MLDQKDEKQKLADVIKIFVDESNEICSGKISKIICIGAVCSPRELLSLDTNLSTRFDQIKVPLLTDKEIKEIQLSYVTKDELKDVKNDLNKSIGKLQTDVEQIKESCLTKPDFYRSQMQTDKKIDKIYDLLIKQQMEGSGNDTR